MGTTTASISETAASILRAEMARKKRTGVDLAQVLHVSQQSASRRINGDTPLSLDELALAAHWLELPVTHFLGSVA